MTMTRKANPSADLADAQFPDLLAAGQKKKQRVVSPPHSPREVIDLSYHQAAIAEEDDDAILDELLEDGHDDQYRYNDNGYSVSTPPNQHEYYNDYEEEEDEEDEEEEEEEEEAEDEVSVGTLLTRAHDRLHLQDLHDEVDRLKEVIERKNQELENMSGQLRRAVATKCDLVLAHTELELHHENNLKRRDQGLLQLKKANLGLIEAQSEVEKDLLNEIYVLTEKQKQMEKKHRDELDDWERLHKSEMIEKDLKIKRLQEEILRLKSGGKNKPSSSPNLWSRLKA